MKKGLWAALALVASLGVGSVAAAAGEGKETFTATLLQSADLRQSSTRTWPITFHVERWTSGEEIARLRDILKEGGSDALLREFQKGETRAGYVQSPAIAREPSWRVAVATVADTPRGRVVRLLTDRPTSIVERWSGARSLEYEFAAFEFTLDEKGRGHGIAIPAARLAQDEEGRVSFETLPYTTGPERLIGVRSWGGDKTAG